ncbi:ATPase [Aromatoleum toluvorans]|uniref:histidine kinase n=1 Tax=Aromatoleum toluvorans TaxID=92002 RepID=A0ABX1Q2P9_9RHOO|nr:ATPase [Aromatoleum toluvorans]
MDALTTGNAEIDERLQRMMREHEARIAELARELERERALTAELVARVERTQSQLLQSEKMAAIGQLAAGVAHEINNPVGFVSSNLGSLASYVERLFGLLAAYEQLEQELPPDHAARAQIAKARDAAEIDYLREDIPDLLRESADGVARVRHIVNDLKDFSRADEGEWQEADLNRGLESTLNVVWNEIKYKAEVVREFGELPKVRCIPAQINQVFMNLLVNAAQAIDTSGTITLRSGASDEEAWIEIKDTGKGMPPDVQARIFEPFFTTKPVGKGTGLGLSISADIVKRHKGALLVDSQPGGGTRFRIVLPLRTEGAGDQTAAK